MKMNEMTVLQKIEHSVRARLEGRKKLLSPKELRVLCQSSRTPHAFPGFGVGVNVIAEVKFTSPSEGALSDPSVLSPVAVASDYLKNGARALSVLTEQDYFKGSPEFLQEIRQAHPDARILMKDFILDEYQLFEARTLGADAVLLIVALLGEKRAAELLQVSRDLGLAALVEVHDEKELESAVKIGATLIGINNRNLKTLEVSLETSLRLAPLAPRDAILVSESGITGADEIRKLRQAGYHGFLIGSTLMKSGTPGAALASLISEFLG